MSVDLNFTSSGGAQVLAEQQRLKDGAAAMALLWKQENKDIAALARTANQAFNQTRTELEKLETQAEALQKVVADTKLPELDRKKAGDALARVNTKIDEAKKKLGEVGTEASKTGAVLKDAFGGAKNAIFGPFVTGAGAAAAAVGLTIKVVGDELRDLQELANAAQKTQVTLSASRNAVIRNLPGADEATILGVLAENEKLAGSTGVSERDINAARAQALSASGGDRDASFKAVEIAGKFLADTPGDIGGFAGSLLDLAKVTGTTDANVNLGLLSTVGGLSRVVDQGQIARNVPKALIGAREFGFSTQESAALFGSLSTAGADVEGAVTGTALIQLAKQLEAFNPEALAGKSTGQKLRALQGDSGLSADFLGNASFEVKALGPIRALLTNKNSEAARLFREQLSAIPDNAGLGARGRASLAAFDANPLNRTARFGRALGNAEESLLGGLTLGSLTDEQTEQVKKTLIASGESGVGRQIFGSRNLLDRQLSTGAAEALIEDRLRQIDSPLSRTRREQSLANGGRLSDRQQQELRSIEILTALLTEFKALRTDTQEQTDEVKNGAGFAAGAD